MIIIHFTINSLLILSSLFVFLIENAVHSILLLVLSFLNASIICFIFGAEFLGLSFIIIYVGAIAILFLFVIMMLNVKIEILGLLKFLPLILLFSLIVFIQIYIAINSSFSNSNFLYFNFSFIESISNDFFLGQALYNYFSIGFLLAGFLLLVGMIGAIILTFNFKIKKINEISYKQLARSNKLLNFFK
jgi:NADH-quinone oxidoreductase subunit J